jgi:hypothetical protein
MAKIIVGFSRSSLIFSRIIRWFSKGDVSHSYIKIPVPDFGESIVFHAVWLKGVQYINYGLFKEDKEIVAEYEIEIKEEEALEFEKFRVRNCGRGYSTMTLLGFLPIMLKLWKKNKSSDGDASFVCSEMVARCLCLKNAEETTPQMLLDYCKLLSKTKLAKPMPFI